MLPPSDELPDVLPTERLLANGKPVPELRVELRRIPNLLNAWSVVALWLSTVAIIAVAIWIDHPLVWLAAFVLMGPQFAAVRQPGSRGRAPPAVLEQAHQRLRRPLGARLSGVHVDRSVPARAHGAPQGRVRAERTRHEPLQRLSDHQPRR